MSNGHCFDTDTVMKFVNKMIFPETTEVAATPTGATSTTCVVQTSSIQFQEEWVLVRTAMMRVVREFHGAKERFLQVFAELQPMMLAPEWLESE